MKQGGNLQPNTFGITHVVKALKPIEKHTAEPAYLDWVPALVSNGNAKLHYCLH
jgi:hypothetical protein